MMQVGRVRALLLGAAFITGPTIWAQRAPRLDVSPRAAGDAGAIVTSANLFAEPDMRDLVRAGFPASLRYRLELWRAGGFINDVEGRLEWELIVQFDPSAQRYRVIRRQSGKLEDLGSFATL